MLYKYIPTYINIYPYVFVCYINTHKHTESPLCQHIGCLSYICFQPDRTKATLDSMQTQTYLLNFPKVPSRSDSLFDAWLEIRLGAQQILSGKGKENFWFFFQGITLSHRIHIYMFINVYIYIYIFKYWNRHLGEMRHIVELRQRRNPFS